MKWSSFCLLLAACTQDAAPPLLVDDLAVGEVTDLTAMPVDAASPDLRSPSPSPTIVDLDQDGLDDFQELRLAGDYLPYLSLSPQDKCPTGGILARISPHKDDPAFVHILYDYLFDQDCGLGGHAGDDEVFAITVDPRMPPPAGIVAMKAISHQGTLCERVSTCGRCVGLDDCATLMKNGVAWPAWWSSRDKHGGYVNKSATCTTFATCFDQCDDNSSPALPRIVNAGEPGHPLIHDLTDEGFITTINGWKNMELFHFDPWKSQDFGGAGDLSKDLVDPAFDTPACN